MLDGESNTAFEYLNVESNPFLQLLKTFSSLDILAFLALSFFLRKKVLNNTIDKILLLILFLTLLASGIISGSRFNVILPFFILLYVFYDYVKKNRLLLFFPTIIFSFFSISVVVPAISTYRNIAKYVELSAFDILARLDFSQFEYWESFKDVMSTRLNSLHGFHSALEYFMENEKVDFFYHYNFISVIPRFIWKSKPVIGLNLNEYAWKLGLIDDLDYGTSVGFGGIYGDTFIQFGFWGFIFAGFHAYLYFILKSIKSGNDLFSFCYTFLFAKMLLSVGSFIAILPSIIYVFIPSLILILLFYTNSAKY